jgi:hypothetical protein
MSGATYEPIPPAFRPFGRAAALHIASRSNGEVLIRARSLGPGFSVAINAGGLAGVNAVWHALAARFTGVAMSGSDIANLDIGQLNIDRVSTSQIVEFISRQEIDLVDLVDEILIAQGYQTRKSLFGKDGSVDILAEGARGPLGYAPFQVTANEQFLDQQARHDGLAGTWIVGQ